MTEIEYLEARLHAVQEGRKFLESRIKYYLDTEKTLTMELNRARRLERQARELLS